MTTISQAVAQIKGALARLLPPSLVDSAFADPTRPRRCRYLTPAVTAYLALRQVLHGGTAAGLRFLAGRAFTASAYCQARGRLSVLGFHRLMRAAAGRYATRPGDRRVWLVDGTGISMPDTPELQEEFGQPGNQKPGCGFPVAHMLCLFEAATGILVRVVVSPLRTHDMTHAAATHADLAPGDLLVGDRAFESYAHLALLQRRGAHGLFRLHQKRRPGDEADRRVVREKPPQRPRWMSAEAYAALPERMTVRELRVRVTPPGRRERTLYLVTTLLDKRRDSAKALAKLYERRWRVEVDLRHLKQTLGLDAVRSKTVPGVMKDILAFATAYNLVRKVMLEAAAKQGVTPDRIGFADAVRWLCAAKPREAVPELIVHPERPGRFEPHVVKRRPKQSTRMTKPRRQLRDELRLKGLAA